MPTSFPASRPCVRSNASYLKLVRLFAAIVLLPLFTVAATAQATASPKYSWERVKLLSPGSKLHVNTAAKDHTECKFVSATDATLTCGGAVFQRADIVSIKTAHRTRSTFVGLGAGYVGAGLITAAAFAGSNNSTAFGSTSRCSSITCGVTIAFIELGVVIATPILFHIYDLTATTVYKREP